MAQSSIKAIVTDSNGRFDARAGVVTAARSWEAGKHHCRCFGDERQPISSDAGAAFTDAACYMISRLEDAPRKALLQELLGEDGMGFSVARTSVGQSDYGRVRYSYDDTPDDLELKDLLPDDYDRPYISSYSPRSPRMSDRTCFCCRRRGVRRVG